MADNGNGGPSDSGTRQRDLVADLSSGTAGVSSTASVGGSSNRNYRAPDNQFPFREGAVSGSAGSLSDPPGSRPTRSAEEISKPSDDDTGSPPTGELSAELTFHRSSGTAGQSSEVLTLQQPHSHAHRGPQPAADLVQLSEGLDTSLPPDHPLLARAQAALARHLTDTKRRLQEELRETKTALKVQVPSLSLSLCRDQAAPSL